MQTAFRIWEASTGAWEDYYTIGLFTSRAAAEAAAKEWQEKNFDKVHVEETSLIGCLTDLEPVRQFLGAKSE